VSGPMNDCEVFHDLDQYRFEPVYSVEIENCSVVLYHCSNLGGLACTLAGGMQTAV